MKHNGILGKKAVSNGLAAFLVFIMILAGATAAYYAYNHQGCPTGYYWAGTSNGCQPIPTTPSPPAPGTSATASGTGYALWFTGLQNWQTGTDLTAGSAAIIDIFDPADHSRVLETIDYDAYGTVPGSASSGYYLAGTRLLVHVACGDDVATYGLDYYDEWYMVTAGGAVTILRPPDSIGVSTTAAISEQPYGTSFLGTTSSGGTYWIVNPALKMYSRSGYNYVTWNLFAGGTALLSSASDGNTVSTVADKGSQTTNTFTATGKQFTLTLQAATVANSQTWGRPMILLSAAPPYDFQVRYPAIWVAVNSTSVGRDFTLGQGFSPVTTQPSGWWVVWKTLATQGGIAAVYSTPSNQPTYQWNIPIDTTAITASTKLCIAVYVGDLQLPGDAAVGSADGTPTYYGGSSYLGPSSVWGYTYSIAAAGINAGSNTPTVSTQAHGMCTTV